MKDLKKYFIKKLVISSFFFSLAIVVPYYSSKYIGEKFISPPVLKDLIWEKLPYFSIIWLSEILLIFSVLYMFVWAIKKNKDYIPYAIFLYSLFQIIRSGLIVLTPMGIPDSYSGLLPLGEKSVFMYGTFPSGHLSYPFNTYLITKSKIALLLSFAVALILLISRAHYSIDLIGTILLTFFIYALSEKYLKKYFIKNET